MMQENKPMPVLSVKELSVTFGRGSKQLCALDKVSFEVQKGEILALVGESGCGKSVAMMSVMGLLPKRSAHISAAQISLSGTDLHNATSKSLRQIRGQRIGMIFQDPMTSLNPVFSVGYQLMEPLMLNLGLSRAAAEKRAIELLNLVKIPEAKRRMRAFPHELSGGMRQRVMIAMALTCDPELLIADEPTTALDVTVQVQILDLINELRRELGMSVVLITHDLGVVALAADQVSVMYAGRVVERGPVGEIFAHPSHGYTAGLIRSLPGNGQARQSPLEEISGSVPKLAAPSENCSFAPRCAFAQPDCHSGVPASAQISETHASRCFHHQQVATALKENNTVRAWS